MTVGDVVVEAHRRGVLVALGLGLIHKRLRVARRRLVDTSGDPGRGLDLRQHAGNRRINGADLAVGTRQREQINRLLRGHAAHGAVVGEDARARGIAKNRARACHRRRLVLVFEVRKEKRLAATVVTRQHNRTTHTGAVLMDDDVVLRQVVDLVEVRIRVELRIAPVVVDARIKLVRTRAGRERNLHGAGARADAGHGTRDGDFLDRVHTRRDHREEPVGGGQGLARADAVNRDVDGVVRQAVDQGRTRAARGGDTRQHGHGVQRITRDQRQLGELLGGECRRHGRGLGLDKFGAGLDLDCFGQGTDFELGRDFTRPRGKQTQVVGDKRLEAGQRHRDGVGAGVDHRERKPSRGIAHGLNRDVGGIVLHDHGGAGNGTAVCIHNHAREGRGRGALSQCVGTDAEQEQG